MRPKLPGAGLASTHWGGVRLLRVLLGWLLLLWLLPSTGTAQPTSKAASELRFERAEFVVSDSETPPQTGWYPQSLPDSWLHSHPELVGFAWYRMRFRLETAPAQAMALFVGRVATTGQFWVNGSVLNPQVRFTQPGGLKGNEMSLWPQLITLPAGLLRAGDNVLNIRVQGGAVGGHGLWDVRIGTIEQLRPAWLAREVPQRMVPEALLVLMAAGSFVGLVVWGRDKTALNLHVAAVMLLWTLIVGVWVFPDPPLSLSAMSAFFTVLFIVFHWALLALFYRYSASTWRWYPPALHVISALTLVLAMPIFGLGARLPHAPEMMGAVLLAPALLRTLATIMLLQSAFRLRSARAYALAGTEVLWFVGHLQLIGIITGWLPPVPFRLEPAGSLPLYLVLLYFFVDGLMREREQAVRDQQAAISAERARVLQDMHDGIGSQLITMLRLAKRTDSDRSLLARAIEEALQDLRLVVDALEGSDQDLVQMLGNLRYRLEPRLAPLGIRLSWNVHTLPELAGLTPQSKLNVLRVVQEAINNAVKHARASTIDVSVAQQASAITISVADDGVGFDPAATMGTGRGLSGMQKRADRLGARLVVAPRDGGGASVALHLPSAPAAPSLPAGMEPGKPAAC